ncbi:MAG: hypothetical protein EBS19_08330 [Spirochaetia bacterium]|nr:hypothetical protein [Spirochaetia bacterium]
MKSFREKFIGLSEEQIKIKHKIWEREKEKERLLKESLEKKRKIPFKEEDEGDEGGSYGGSLDVDGSYGVVSDAALVSSDVSFNYNNGNKIFTKTDIDGRFNIPRSFGNGYIIVNGGKDSVNGLDYKGQYRIDSSFFHKFRAITPITHIASHIWDCTPTRTPAEAMNLVIENLTHLSEVKLPNIDSGLIFNDDHVKLSLRGADGAVQIQAINTIIEIYSDLIGALKSNCESEMMVNKIHTYREIADSLLTKVNGQVSINYLDDIFKFHLTNQEEKHEKCCYFLIDKAVKSINKALCKDVLVSTKEIQALNYVVKTEWSNASLNMTTDKRATPEKIWDGIEKKNPALLIDSINIPVSY